MTRDEQLSPEPYLVYPGFACFKSWSPIQYPRRWLRNVLIQAALDPVIKAVGPSPLPSEAFPPPIEFAFVARLRRATVLVLIADTPFPLPKLPEGIDAAQSLSRAQIMREPQLAAGRAIWATKRVGIRPSDQLAVLRGVSRASDGLPLDRIPSLFSPGTCDPVRETLGLIARGYLSIDIHRGLTPDNPVRLGPLAHTSTRGPAL
jgi:hypothetical protein